MSLLKLARAAALALLAACAGADGGETPEAAGMQDGAAQATSLAAAAEAEGSAACELPSGGYGEACDACLAARCCAPLEECKGDASCGQQLRCIVECQNAESPTACSMACISDGVHASYVAYDDCSFAECLSECWM